MARKRYSKPFKYKPKNPEKYVGDVNNIVMRSLWERKFAIWCDLNESVLNWNSEGLPIQYWHTVDKRFRNYYVDFFVKIKKKDGSTQNLMIEVKPYCETQPPVIPKRKTDKTNQRYINECLTYQRNIDKWNAASAWAKQNGFVFKIMTEYELGIKKRKE